MNTRAPAGGRTLPAVTPLTEHFWRSGSRGELTVMRCQSCGLYQHPPLPICSRCLSRDRVPVVLSGKGVVASFTVNYQPWRVDMVCPFVIAIVELDEQIGLRVTTNITNCPMEDVHIGMRVRVTFEQHEDVWLPMFEPDPSWPAARKTSHHG